jgi:hypothetical protein
VSHKDHGTVLNCCSSVSTISKAFPLHATEVLGERGTIAPSHS